MNNRDRGDEIQFMDRMMNTYGKVHNSKYWSEIDSIVPREGTKQILDIGCGPGLLLKESIDHYNVSNAVGIDLSPVMLSKANEVLEPYKSQVEVNLVEQHMQEDTSLPVAMDLIFCSRVMRSFENVIDVLQEVKKSLSVNGYFILLDWDRLGINSYLKYFENDDYLKTMTFEDKIRLQRNFSKYSLEDWFILFNHVGLSVVHSFQLDPAHIVVIAKK